MSKTAEQFDADVVVLIERFASEFNPMMSQFNDRMNAFLTELSESTIPDHLKLAIAENFNTRFGEAVATMLGELK